MRSVEQRKHFSVAPVIVDGNQRGAATDLAGRDHGKVMRFGDVAYQLIGCRN
jgi:hypothetical protein